MNHNNSELASYIRCPGMENLWSIFKQAPYCPEVWTIKIQYFKVAEHSFQVPMPNPP